MTLPDSVPGVCPLRTGIAAGAPSLLIALWM
jgi:hypothetical protein